MTTVATGDLVLAAVLAGIALADVPAAAVLVLAAVAPVVRWGTSSMTGMGSDQAVLGAAVVVGPALAAGSAWCSAFALAVAPGALPRPSPAVVAPAVLLAGLVAAGPTDAAGWWVRVASTLAAALVAAAAVRLPPRAALVGAAVLAVAAVVLAGVA